MRPIKIETIRQLDGLVHAALATPGGLARLCDPMPLELSGYVVEQRPAKAVDCPGCSGRWVKVCACCGRPYTAADWARLEAIGTQRVPGAPDVELRNCGCGTTLGIERSTT